MPEACLILQFGFKLKAPAEGGKRSPLSLFAISADMSGIVCLF